MTTLDDPVRATDTAGPWGALRIAGSDARAFLQGQLSNDLRQLTPRTSLLAALNSPQGRVIALLRLIERADGILALLPRSMIGTAIERLRKYVLRSKVTLAPAAELSLLPLVGIAPGEMAALLQAEPPAAADAHVQRGDISGLHLPGPTARSLVVASEARIQALHQRGDLPDADWNTWRLAQIAAGEPQVYPATSEHFVAQMLNLDLIGGLSFTKGCYTGQEIIARTQHLGRIKRRMVRARHSGSVVAPGDKLFEGQASAGEIVETALRGDGTTELLAVIQLTHAPGALHLPGFESLQELTLPYSLAVPST